MKKLHSFYVWDIPQAEMFKNMLAEEGVECLIKNARLSAGMGEIPFTECFPELWVIDDEVYPRAKLLLHGWLSQEVDPEAKPWVCSNCGEQSAPQFASCWNCSQSRD